MKNNMLLNNKFKKMWHRNWLLFLLAFPGVLAVILFNYLPMFGVVIAFKDYTYQRGILGSEWAGLKHFEFFFKSNDAAVIIRNTILYHAWFFIIGAVCQIIVALLLYQLNNKHAIRLYHTSIILPNFVSWVLVAYLVFSLLSNRHGMFNSFLVNLGQQPIDWYTEPKYWPTILTVVHLWKNVGIGCIVYYAALMGIDASLFEAAEIDGAGRFKQMWHIAIPALMPMLSIFAIMNLGSIMTGDFGLFYQVPMNSGALYSVTDIINTYTTRGLQAGNMSQTAAVGLFQSVVGSVLLVGTNAIVRKVSPDNSMF